MTDAKQALEVVERLREGAGRVARHCMRQAEHGDPGLISIPRHERDIDAIMEQAASLLSSLAEENERLRVALKDCADDLEAEILARANSELPRRIDRDLETVRVARQALSPNNPAGQAMEGDHG